MKLLLRSIRGWKMVVWLWAVGVTAVLLTGLHYCNCDWYFTAPWLACR